MPLKFKISRINFRKKIFLSAVLTKSLKLKFGFVFFSYCQINFANKIPILSLEGASEGPLLVEDCIPLIYCFVTEFISSIQFTLPFSKTGALRRSLIFLIKLPSKTTAFDVSRLYLLSLLFQKKSVKTLIKIFFCIITVNKKWFSFSSFKDCFKRMCYYLSIFVFDWISLSKLWKIINIE